MMQELLVIVIVAIVVFRPQKLPELAERLGRLLGQGKKFKAQWSDHITQPIDDLNLHKQLEINLEKAKQAEQQCKAHE